MPGNAMTAHEVCAQLDTRKGWHLVKCSWWTAMTLVGAGYVKAHIVGNAPNTFQMRLTGAGREWAKQP